MKQKLIYFGSPDFSATILESLIQSDVVTVVGVVTTPDKPTGRNLNLIPSPVAVTASHHNLPVYKPAKLDDANLTHLKLLKPDLSLVVSYGKIIPESWLNLAKLGTFNIHFSLLPRYRGALCISEAIKNQDKETGVTLMVMDKFLDHGPLIYQTKISIDINDNNATLNKKLTQAAITLLANKLPEICSGNYPQTYQDETQVTLTPSYKTNTRPNAYIPLETIKAAFTGINSATTHALIRSQNPDPGAWTKIDNQEIKIIESSLVNQQLSIDTVQIPGKSPISWKQFLSGHPLH